MNTISSDGTGEPNLEGINYYNRFIDALLEKGYQQIYHVFRIRTLFPIIHKMIKYYLKVKLLFFI